MKWPLYFIDRISSPSARLNPIRWNGPKASPSWNVNGLSSTSIRKWSILFIYFLGPPLSTSSGCWCGLCKKRTRWKDATWWTIEPFTTAQWTKKTKRFPGRSWGNDPRWWQATVVVAGTAPKSCHHISILIIVDWEVLFRQASRRLLTLDGIETQIPLAGDLTSVSQFYMANQIVFQEGNEKFQHQSLPFFFWTRLDLHSNRSAPVDGVPVSPSVFIRTTAFSDRLLISLQQLANLLSNPAYRKFCLQHFNSHQIKKKRNLWLWRYLNS